MLIILIFSLGLSLLLLKTKQNNPSNVYLGLFYLLCSVDVFLKITRDYLIYNNSFDILVGSVSLRDSMLILLFIVNTFTNFLMPLFFFIFSAGYSDMVKHRYFKFVLLPIVLVTFIAFLLINERFPVSYYAYHLREVPSVLPFYIWNTILVIFAAFLAIYSYINEILPSKKKEKLLVFIIFILPITIMIIARYVFTLMRIEDTYSTMRFIQAISFFLFFYFLIKQGLMGLKLNIEYYGLNAYKKSFASNTSLISHALKNDLLKISLYLNNIKFHGQANAEILKSSDAIDTIINRLILCISKISENSKKQSLELSVSNIYSLVNETIEDVMPFVKTKDIDIVNSCDCSLDILCDKFHIYKMLENILINSIDSISENGLIKISTQNNRKYISIVIEDTGEGIQKDKLSHVTEPYFTTKKNKCNFGLGLYYCCNIMELHMGSLDIQSTEGKGTTVYLHFPTKRR